MTTTNQDDKIAKLLSDELLDGMTDVLKEGFRADYTRFMVEIGYLFTPDEIFDRQELLDWVKLNYSPEDVFDRRELSAWAEGEGYRNE